MSDLNDSVRIGNAISSLHNHSRIKVAARRKKGLSTCLDNVPTLQKLAVLVEEFGEIGNLFNQSTNDDAMPDQDKLREELLDLANGAMLWAEALRV